VINFYRAFQSGAHDTVAVHALNQIVDLDAFSLRINGFVE